MRRHSASRSASKAFPWFGSLVAVNLEETKIETIQDRKVVCRRFTNSIIVASALSEDCCLASHHPYSQNQLVEVLTCTPDPRKRKEKKRLYSGVQLFIKIFLRKSPPSKEFFLQFFMMVPQPHKGKKKTRLRTKEKACL
jgi:hypothetical protein